MRAVGVATALAMLASGARAAPVELQPPLAGLAFLVGDWSSGRGVVAETGGTSDGSSSIEAEVGGAVLLRRDHTRLFDKAGKPMGAFDQIMMIYPEDGKLHAEYADGSHVIHYTSAVVSAGRSVVFTSAPLPGAPTFRLAYELAAPDRLNIAFSMATPGGSAFRPIATGTVTRARSAA